MKLINRIEKIAKILEKPNYFFTKTSDGEIILYLENKNGEKYEFREYTMLGTVNVAEEFIKNNYPEVDSKQLNLFENNENK
jgi:hypothetical protein